MIGFAIKHWKLILGAGCVLAFVLAYFVVSYRAYQKGYDACKNELKDSYIEKAKKYDKIIANRPDDTALFDLLQKGNF